MAGPEKIPGIGHHWRTPLGQHPVPMPHVGRWYTWTATALGASMWFFLFYRMKKDGAVLFGLRHPWDH